MKKYIANVVFGSLIFLSFEVFATAYEAGNKNITGMRFYADGVLIRLNPAPNNCNGGDQYRMHVRLPKTHLNYESMLSGLLTARASNMPIKYLWVSNEGITCNQANILMLESYEI